MAIYNLGSINLDYVYEIPRLPTAGETLTANRTFINLGGKGLNISVALHRAGVDVVHIGAIGAEDTKAQALLAASGIRLAGIAYVDAPTGHAVVYVDAASENQIVIFPGANHAITEAHIRDCLRLARPGDWLVLQNETNVNATGLRIAREKGMKIALVAAPFDANTIPDLIPQVDLVSMNETETLQFEEAIGGAFTDIQDTTFLITYGAKGSLFYHNGTTTKHPAFFVSAKDTTAAGDTFFGAFMAEYSSGTSPQQALPFAAAAAAAALKVQHKGAAAAIPERASILAFLDSQPQ
jgi:ribokinase